MKYISHKNDKLNRKKNRMNFEMLAFASSYRIITNEFYVIWSMCLFDDNQSSTPFLIHAITKKQDEKKCYANFWLFHTVYWTLDKKIIKKKNSQVVYTSHIRCYDLKKT